MILNPSIEQLLSTQASVDFFADRMEKLRRRNSNELGFQPVAQYKRALLSARVIFAPSYFGDGFLWWGQTKDHITINQLVIKKADRLIGLGTQLVRYIEEIAYEHKLAIKFRCREDLQANEFWNKLDYNIINISSPDNARNKKINHYRKEYK